MLTNAIFETNKNMSNTVQLWECIIKHIESKAVSFSLPSKL